MAAEPGLAAPCERCGVERGVAYTFPYGRQNSYRGGTTITTESSLNGLRRVVIGDRCATDDLHRGDRFVKRLAPLLLAVTLVGIVASVAVFAGWGRILGFVASAIVGFLGIAFLLPAREVPQAIARNRKALALATARRWARDQGYVIWKKNLPADWEQAVSEQSTPDIH